MKNSLFILLVLFILSCKKENITTPISKPEASFIYTGGACTAPCAVLFENKSTNAKSFFWEFGDGSTSIEKDPTKNYLTGGTYVVKLTASNEAGESSTTRSILIQKSVQSQLPKANFSFTGGNCNAPCAVTFTNSSADATEYSWDFGDGGTSKELNPTYTYKTAGTYTVGLTAKNAAGSNSTSKTVTIASQITKLIIKNVKLTSAPLGGFDVFNGPDIYFNIVDKNNVAYTNGRSSYFSDVENASFPLNWTLTTPFTWDIINPIYFDFWDWDTPDADDYMGVAGFSPSSLVATQPKEIVISQNNFSIFLTVDWQ